MPNTKYRVVINLLKKTAKTQGEIALGETIDLLLFNTGTAVAGDLYAALCFRGDRYAVCNSFSSGSGSIDGVMDLDTTELADAFANIVGRGKRTFYFCVWDNSNDNLLVNEPVEIMNNPYYTGSGGVSPVVPPDNQVMLYDNQVNHVNLGAAADIRAYTIEYVVDDGSDYQFGEFKIYHDGTTAYIEQSYIGAYFDSISWDADISGSGQIRIVATVASHGSDIKMVYEITGEIDVSV